MKERRRLPLRRAIIHPLDRSTVDATTHRHIDEAMRIIQWTEDDVHGLARLGVSRVLTESDDDGRIVREIGLVGESVRYKASSLYPATERRGMFDLQLLAAESRTGPDDIARSVFEHYWGQSLD